MSAALRCAARRIVVAGRGLQRTPPAASEEGWRRLSPSFSSGPSRPRRFSSHQRGESDGPLTFEQKVALWKRGGRLLYRTTNVIATFVASYYVLKLSVELAVNEYHEHGYMVRKAVSFIKRSEDKLRSLRDR